MKKLLVVEDDLALQQEIKLLFEENKYQVFVGSSLKEASDHLSRFPDLLVLDRNLPDGEGLSWLLRQRQQQWMVPTLMLTARDSTLEKVSGLEMGANDYLTKPFDPLELLARVRVLLGETLLNFAGSQWLYYEDFKLNPQTRELSGPAGTFTLAPIESKCLCFLVERAGQVFSREELLERVWEISSTKETRAVDNAVAELRKYIGQDKIETIRGRGYRLREAQKRTSDSKK